jgi:hypothetical protein
MSGRPLGAQGDLPGSIGELLLARSLKVAAVLLVGFVADRVARWTVRRIVRGLQQQQVQQRLQSIRAKTPRALLASTNRCPTCAGPNAPTPSALCSATCPWY